MRRTLLLLLCCTALFVGRSAAQNQHNISGTVTDATGMPVAGATITIKGTNRATATGNDGSFLLSVSGKDKVLVISAINFLTQEVDIAGKSSIGTVTLVRGTKNLDEVVVVAYGTQKKTNITGAVAQINGNQVADRPLASVDQALQGASPGLMVSAPNGIPGSNVDVRIRGIGSINASASPLWVIDGVEAVSGDLASTSTSTNALSGLNPDDIESISVLKDAAATALYGSRGANGVIIVTTKKGKAGKTRINFTTEVGRNSVAFAGKHNRPLTTPQYHQLLDMATINGGYATDNASADAFITDPNNGLGLPANWTNTNTDWLHEVTRTGNQQQYNLSLSGGNDKTQYFASAGYFDQDGTTIATNFKRYNGNISVSSKLNDRINFNAGLNGSYSYQIAPPGSAAYASPVSGAFFLPPYYSPYNSDGSLRYNDSLGEFPEGAQFNPLAIAAFNRYTDGQTELRGYVSGEYQILDNLKFSSKYSGEFIDANEYLYWNPIYGDGYPLGYGVATDRKVFDWTWTNQVNYRANLNQAKDFYLDLLVGSEAYKLNDYTIQAQGQNFPSTTLLTYLASAAAPVTAFNLPQGTSLNSYFSQAVFNYQDRYILSGSYRLDGSSIFAQNHKWGNFYSVGASWNLNEENFMKNLDAFNLMKLRASYGQTGNDLGFKDYPALALYDYGSPYEGNAGSALSQVGNPNLTWELNKAFNVGLDWGIWKDRLGGSIDYYKRTTSKLLVNVPLSATSGVPAAAGSTSSTQPQNVGSMYNQGIEITLTGKPIQTRDFTWTSSINFSHNKNRVTELYNHRPISIQTRYNITEGHDIHEFYTRLWDGANPANGDPQWFTDATRKTVTSTSNQVKLSLTGKVGTPQYFGAWTNTFNYKGLSLTAQLYYNFGNYVYSTWENYLMSDGLYLPYFGQLSNELTQSWTHAGQVTNFPKQVLGGNKNSNVPSTRYLYKGNYIRLRNIELAYSLPKTTMEKARINNITIYVRGTNLLTFATDKNLSIDPELGASSIADFQVFTPKSITAGVKLGF
ncbi:MAG TPA: TonB-dependent receptor [Puia sp.]|nr:TonB-dependent receptor [Puia sp.]